MPDSKHITVPMPARGRAGAYSSSLGVWDPTGSFNAGGTAYRDASPAARNGMINVAFRFDSGNREVVRERRPAVVNAREVDRNNTMIRAGITKRAIDMVGSNLRLQSMPNYEALGLTEEWAAEFANQFENHFSLWGDDPRKLNDAMRHSNFGAQMLETCRGTYGADGEAALVIRYNEERMSRYRGRYATFVEVIDPDRISNPDGLADDEYLCQGRQLDEWGAYTALHLSRSHPSDPKGTQTWDVVPRETAYGRPVGVHWFPRYRQGAQRAMPAIIGSLRDVRMLDQFDQKTLEQAVKAAFMSIFVETDATSAEALAKLSPQRVPDGSDPFINLMNARFGLYEDLNVEGQSMPVLAPGDKIGIATSSHAANNTDSFRFAFERKFASLLGLSYARFSNDYSKTSFASIRAEFIDAWRMTFSDRYQFCGSVASPIGLAFLEELIVTDKIILPAGAPDFYDAMTEYAQCEWRGPGMGWVDPVKDVTGAGLRVLGGFSNPIAEASAQGSDFYDNIDATGRAIAYAKRKKIDLQFGTTGATPEEAEAPAELAANPDNPANAGAASTSTPEPADA